MTSFFIGLHRFTVHLMPTRMLRGSRLPRWTSRLLLRHLQESVRRIVRGRSWLQPPWIDADLQLPEGHDRRSIHQLSPIHQGLVIYFRYNSRSKTYFGTSPQRISARPIHAAPTPNVSPATITPIRSAQSAPASPDTPAIPYRIACAVNASRTANAETIGRVSITHVSILVSVNAELGQYARRSAIWRCASVRRERRAMRCPRVRRRVRSRWRGTIKWICLLRVSYGGFKDKRWIALKVINLLIINIMKKKTIKNIKTNKV